MVDYYKDTGSSGSMRIRDTGTSVEFWINAGNSSTFANQMPWGSTVNGVTNNNREFRYNAGAGWEYLGGWNVTYDQTVTFRLFDTGTSGLGGPTTFSRAIERSSAPAPPSRVSAGSVTATSLIAYFSDGDNGGISIDSRQIGYGTSSTTPQTIISSDGSTSVTGLTSGGTYYFWARTHNSKGWSAWGPRSSIVMPKVPDAPNQVTVTEITQSSARINFTGNGSGGSAVVERTMYYNTSNTTVGATAVPWVSGGVVVTNLLPGTIYHFWARERNAQGWSAYSPVKTARTFAGAYVKVGAIYKEAVPWVKHDGVWKVARPWSRVAGVWRETL